jgi:alkylated DNA nucleotide flippase Atl1
MPEPTTRLDSESRAARILARVRGIPEGFVRTYGDIDPGAPRMVGAVLARLQQDDVPWHRVVRSDGTVAKGEEQLARLRGEGVPIHRGRVDLRLARLPPEAH